MNRIHIDKCPVCNSDKIKSILKCTDYYASQKQFEVCMCEDCGFTFTQDFPDESEIGKYYETKDYISHSDTKKGIINRIYHHVRSYMLKKKSRMILDVSGKKKGSILDIGCGTGYFLNEMKSLGWETKGVEKSDSAREYAKKQFGLDISESINNLSGREVYDVITLWHVLEHLQDLKLVFLKLREMLKKDGVLVVALPNPESYDAKKYKEHWAAYDVPRHLWHFKAETFARLAASEGFMIEKFTTMPFDAFYVSMLSEKYLKSSVPFVKGMFTGTKALFASANDPQKSSSLIYVLKKK